MFWYSLDFVAISLCSFNSCSSCFLVFSRVLEWIHAQLNGSLCQPCTGCMMSPWLLPPLVFHHFQSFFSRTFFWKETGECIGKEIFLPENLRLALLGALLVRWLIWAAGIPCSARYSFITWPPFALVKPYLLANCDQLMFASSCHSPASCNSLSLSISRFSILLPWCFFGEFCVWLLSAFLFLVVLTSNPSFFAFCQKGSS